MSSASRGGGSERGGGRRSFFNNDGNAARLAGAGGSDQDDARCDGRELEALSLLQLGMTPTRDAGGIADNAMGGSNRPALAGARVDAYGSAVKHFARAGAESISGRSTLCALIG